MVNYPKNITKAILVMEIVDIAINNSKISRIE